MEDFKSCASGDPDRGIAMPTFYLDCKSARLSQLHCALKMSLANANNKIKYFRKVYYLHHMFSWS